MNIDDFLDKESENNETNGSQIIKKDESLVKKIQSIKSILQRKNLNTATEEFEDLKENFITTAKKQLNDNKVFFREILKLNNEIVVNLGKKTSEVHITITKIRELIRGGRQDVMVGNLKLAKDKYAEIKNLYDDIPTIFREEKHQINEEILAYYINLSKKTEEEIKNNFIRFRDAIKKEIQEAYKLMALGKIQELKAKYDLISRTFDSLPPGFTLEKALIYQNVLKLFSSVYLSESRTIPVNSVSVPVSLNNTNSQIRHIQVSSNLKDLSKKMSKLKDEVRN